MDKPALRRLYKQKRLQLSRAEQNMLLQQMLLHVQQYNWPPVKELFTYLPSEQLREADSISFVRHMRSVTLMHSGKACGLSAPVVNAAQQTMHAVRFDEGSIFNINELGVPEPPPGDIVPPEAIDMVLAPLLACDRHGNRVGYGKGYYDNFLKQCRKDVILAGLSFFEPEAQIEGVLEIDVPLTHCITPEQIYVF